jgi:hypothetical protein
VREQQPAAAYPLAVSAAEDHVVPLRDRAGERRERLEALGGRVALGAQTKVLQIALGNEGAVLKVTCP